MSTDKPSKRNPVGLLFLVALVGSAVATLGYKLFPTDLDVPELTLAQLDEAVSIWQRNGPRDYDAEIEYSSTDAQMDISLRVRDGRAVSGVIDGRAANEEELRRWSIEGQFRQIREDVESRTGASRGPKIRSNAFLIPRAVFDTDYGYPQAYEFKGQGTPLQYEWRVVKLRPVRNT